ncbi:Glucokinase [Marinobacterium lacunae]|uniref:Glucokinase n=1 Tax=Marinobacterium lacunae TaxID=1232683 RepID=A0A081FVU9_9GAMM|nr:glucokinase [Marinobacterium lacunae]KEA62654.1 Glucokinase [Marinobacterium lacunae]
MSADQPTSAPAANTGSCALVADIGGTHARFALMLPDRLRPQHNVTLAVADFDDIESAIRAYLNQAPLAQGLWPQKACLALACPTDRDMIRMTNHGWSFSQARLKRDLGFTQLAVINDYAAQAYAIPSLQRHELFNVGGAEALTEYPVALIGPGTGLGIAGLIDDGTGPRVVVSEGGHADFAPSDDREIEILRYLMRDHAHVSIERILSGGGLVRLYQALCEMQGVKAELMTPAEISAAAIGDGAGVCLDTVETFCAILGSVAGNTALTFGARGGVFITGGIVPRMLDLFAASEFRARFEAKGRLHDYMSAIPTQVVIAEQPGLLGAAAALRAM